MQRVCFLRVFYHKPQFVLLDEATSALSIDVEDELYNMCLDLGVTLISVGHRDTLKAYHNSLLSLEHDGSWSIKTINKHKSQLNLTEENNPTV